jgi:cell division protein FtsL
MMMLVIMIATILMFANSKIHWNKATLNQAQVVPVEFKITTEESKNRSMIHTYTDDFISNY